MPIAPDHVLAVVLAVLFPIRAALFGYRRLATAEPGDVARVRMWLYRQGIAIQWSLTVVTVALWAWQRRPWTMLGVVPGLTWGLIGVAAGLVAVTVYVLAQRGDTLADDEALGRLRARMRNIERLMPRSREEMRWFAALALTAGICEELLYRGYLIWYLTNWMAVLPAAALASAVFGLGHAYQGPKGIVVTALVGAFLSGIYLLTGSLIAGMVLHTLIDLYSGHMAKAAFAREAAAPGAVPEVGAG